MLITYVYTLGLSVLSHSFSAGRCVSLDCEMVGTGSAGDFSMLARCSVVNYCGNVLYDSYVAPMDKITDYRTKFSGIIPQHLRGGMLIIKVCQEKQHSLLLL